MGELLEELSYNDWEKLANKSKEVCEQIPDCKEVKPPFQLLLHLAAINSDIIKAEEDKCFGIIPGMGYTIRKSTIFPRLWIKKEKFDNNYDVIYAVKLLEKAKKISIKAEKIAFEFNTPFKKGDIINFSNYIPRIFAINDDFITVKDGTKNIEVEYEVGILPCNMRVGTFYIFYEELNKMVMWSYGQNYEQFNFMYENDNISINKIFETWVIRISEQQREKKCCICDYKSSEDCEYLSTVLILGKDGKEMITCPNCAKYMCRTCATFKNFKKVCGKCEK